MVWHISVSTNFDGKRQIAFYHSGCQKTFFDVWFKILTLSINFVWRHMWILMSFVTYLTLDHHGHIYNRWPWYRTPFIRNFYALYHVPDIRLSHKIWFGDSWGHFLGWKMPKMAKFGKIKFQISGQWFELGGSYFEVKISSTKASIGDSILKIFFIDSP